MRREVEEDRLGGIKQYILEVVALGAIDLLVWRNAAAAVNRATGIRQLDFAVGRVVRRRASMVVVVVVERYARVVALNESPRRRVVVIRRQREPGVFAQVVNR